MNTTLSEAVTTTFASDEPFFTTEQVTSVAEEIIGNVPVMSLSAPSFDQATLQTAVDDLKGAITTQAQAGGGTVLTAVKKNVRWAARRARVSGTTR